jgi:hypothetical protein
LPYAGTAGHRGELNYGRRRRKVFLLPLILFGIFKLTFVGADR